MNIKESWVVHTEMYFLLSKKSMKGKQKKLKQKNQNTLKMLSYLKFLLWDNILLVKKHGIGIKISNINSSHPICIFSSVCFTLLGNLKCHVKKCILCSSKIFQSEPNASNMFYFILLFSLRIWWWWCCLVGVN